MLIIMKTAITCQLNFLNMNTIVPAFFIRHRWEAVLCNDKKKNAEELVKDTTVPLIHWAHSR